MRPTRLLRSSTFRLALLYLGLLGASVLVLLAFIYWATVGYMSRQVDTVIALDLDGLIERYRRHGPEALIEAVNERAAQDRSGYTLYALRAADQRPPVAGNLKRWPHNSDGDGDSGSEGRLVFDIDDYIARGYDDDGDAWARVRVLAGGEQLLVGRNIEELEEQRELIINALLGGLAITGLLGLAGGVAISFGTVRKIERIQQTSRAIIDGDLSERIPISGADDDVNQLAITLNQMLDQIQSLMDSVRQVSNDIAHDLRTPLTRLRARLEDVADLRNDPRRHRHAVAEAVAETDGLLLTFNALLRIAQVEAGALYSEFTDVDLSAMLRDAVDLYEPLATEKDQRIERRFSQSDLVSVDGDRDLLFQAVINLLDNAIKYAPEGGRIVVALRASAGHRHIEVADNGSGVPAQYQDQVLQRFYRLEAHRGRAGSGLGLSLVAAVAALHRGRLQLADNHPGLRATIVLPARGSQRSAVWHGDQGKIKKS